MSIPPPFGPQPPQGPYQPPQPAQPHQQGAYGPPSYPQYPQYPQNPQNPYGTPGVPGVPGAPGYQPWGQGYSPYNRPAPVSGLAIASLVTGVLCCLPGVGLVLGLIALRRLRERGERGRGMAIGGSVLSGIGLVLGMVLVVTGSDTYIWNGFQEGARAGAGYAPARGECFDEPGGRLTGDTDGVDKVPCSGAHDGEVFATFDLKDGSYPGDDSLAAAADKRCYGLQYTYAMDSWAVPDDVDVYYLTPTGDSWSAGDREVTCVFGNTTEGKDLTGSLRNDASALDPDQVAYLKAAHVFNAAMDTAPDAEYVEDDLPGHKAWAGRVSAALAEQARMLRGHPWPADARAPVAALAAGLDDARAEWAKAAEADDADGFYRHYDAGMRLLDARRSVPPRKALGLETTPPAVDEGGNGDDGDGGGGDNRGDNGGDGSGSTGMQV
ncbi:DUF4190 domain-containing protein [Streptomyces sp. NBC_00820]|uniref:DUF4190 domain-containing protein n=1 Tax=Streptomyces sp. NBC_00820 TaxID=2975842 RepID=UPI002ED34650|nr:DUF4190 domain-containing protein [Streptomyces sp. NBC_00820]